MCSNFRGFVFRGSYFHVLVVGRKNRENFPLYGNLMFPGLSTVHVLITCSLAPKVVIIQTPMDFFSMCVSVSRQCVG